MDKKNTNVEDEQLKIMTILHELVEIGKKKENVLEMSDIDKVFTTCLLYTSDAADD